MKKIKILSLFFAFFIFLNMSALGQPGDILKIHFIDVGEGDSILIETAGGREAILVDVGNLITGFKVVEYLRENNINKLDRLIFTHHDADHIGGAFFVLQMIDVGAIYDNGDDLAKISRESDVFRWYEVLVRKDDNYKVLKKGDVLHSGEMTLKVLWPPQPSFFSNSNNNSLVIMVCYGEFRCLLTGDLSFPGEKKLLKEGTMDLRADVLKVGHHGACDASSEEFLKAVSAHVAVISVNKKDLWGYPSRSVLERLQGMGSKIYRTDEDGDIILSVQSNGKFTVETRPYEER